MGHFVIITAPCQIILEMTVAAAARVQSLISFPHLASSCDPPLAPLARAELNLFLLLALEVASPASDESATTAMRE